MTSARISPPALFFSLLATGLLPATAAFASAGCDAINGGVFDGSFSTFGSFFEGTATNLDVGDTVHFSISNFTGGGSGGAQWWITTDNGLRLDSGSGGLTYSYTMATSDGSTMKSALRIQQTNSSITLTATCVAATPPAPPSDITPLDSVLIEQVQKSQSAQMATMSGYVITGTVGRMISNTFAGLTTYSVSPNGLTFSYVPSPQNAQTPALDAALNLVAPTADWNVWVDVQGSGWHGLDADDGEYGRQVNANSGVTYRLTPDLLVGAFVGLESADYSMSVGSLDAISTTLGGYAGWRVMPGLRWDAVLAHSWLAYGAQAGTASGDFDGSRWLASSALTGSVPVGVVTVEPSISVQAIWEDQTNWVDSLATAHAARSFSNGTVAAGGRVVTPFQLVETEASAYAGLYLDQGFASGITARTLSARLMGGLRVPMGAGGSLALEGQYGGMGSTIHTWSVSAAGLKSF